MGFARQVADRVIFMDEGEIVEENAPEAFSPTRAANVPNCSKSGALTLFVNNGHLFAANWLEAISLIERQCGGMVQRAGWIMMRLAHAINIANARCNMAPQAPAYKVSTRPTNTISTCGNSLKFSSTNPIARSRALSVNISVAGW